MKTSKNDCNHPGIYCREVMGLAGPCTVGYCVSCGAVLARHPIATSEHVKHLQALAARDGKEADRKGIEPCPHGERYVFDLNAGTCALCATWSVERLLASTDLRRLPL